MQMKKRKKTIEMNQKKKKKHAKKLNKKLNKSNEVNK